MAAILRRRITTLHGCGTGLQGLIASTELHSNLPSTVRFTALVSFSMGAWWCCRTADCRGGVVGDRLPLGITRTGRYADPQASLSRLHADELA